MAILLTGGLGYIGSHIAYSLGKKAVVVDNESNSNLNWKNLLPKATVYKSNLNKRILKRIFTSHNINSVIHLAGLKSVNESINLPLKYYKNNVLSTYDLLQSMDRFNIQNLIFSSSATVYGNNHNSPLKENYSLNAINPYASTKIINEKMIEDYCMGNKNFKAISLRYFNPIGSNIKAGLADQPLGMPMNFIPVLIQSVLKNKVFEIFGNDYSTPDGTCIRDYIHILDLVEAHIKALGHTKRIKGFLSMNIGLGKGVSVLEMIKKFEIINKVKINYCISPRREGDVAISFADNKKVKKILKWKPKYDYKRMLQDSWIAYNLKKKYI